jgi:hypothetical protein
MLKKKSSFPNRVLSFADPMEQSLSKEMNRHNCSRNIHHLWNPKFISVFMRVHHWTL